MSGLLFKSYFQLCPQVQSVSPQNTLCLAFKKVFEQKLNFIVPILELKKRLVCTVLLVKCLSGTSKPDVKVQITYSAESATTSGNWQASN